MEAGHKRQRMTERRRLVLWGGKREGGGGCVDKSCLLANLTHGSVATSLLMSGARTISEELLLPPSVALLSDFPSFLVHVGARHRA